MASRTRKPKDRGITPEGLQVIKRYIGYMQEHSEHLTSSSPAIVNLAVAEIDGWAKGIQEVIRERDE